MGKGDTRKSSRMLAEQDGWALEEIAVLRGVAGEGQPWDNERVKL